jgi:hypothetical protein
MRSSNNLSKKIISSLSKFTFVFLLFCSLISMAMPPSNDRIFYDIGRMCFASYCTGICGNSNSDRDKVWVCASSNENCKQRVASKCKELGYGTSEPKKVCGRYRLEVFVSDCEDMIAVPPR